MSKVYTQKIKSQFGPDGEDVMLKIPDDLLKEVEWKEGDYIEILPQDGSLVLKKADMVEIQLDLSEQEYEMLELAAFKKGTTIEEFIKGALEDLK